MDDMNSWNGVGRLGQAVELRHTGGGTAVTDLSMALNSSRKQDNEWVNETTWVSVTVWGRTAELCSEYLSKGSRFGVKGSIKQESWEDRETGDKRTRLKINAERVFFLDTRESGADAGTSNYGEEVAM